MISQMSHSLTRLKASLRHRIRLYLLPMADQDVFSDLLSSSTEYLTIVQKDRVWSDGLYLGADLGRPALLRSAMSPAGCLLPPRGPSGCEMHSHGGDAVLSCKHGEYKDIRTSCPLGSGF